MSAKPEPLRTASGTVLNSAARTIKGEIAYSTPVAAPVAVGDAIIVAESYRGGRKDYRATIVRIIDHGGPGQRPIYNAEFVRGKGIAVLWREEFTLA